MTKIVALSDTHTRHRKVVVPKADIFIFAGDAEFRTISDVTDFNSWLEDLPCKEKIVIAGNHDFFAERQHDLTKQLLTNAIYLENSGYTSTTELKIWGSPMTPTFLNWAFLSDRDKIARYWEQIPEDIDILVTHGPPYGIKDRNFDHLGDEALLKYVRKIKPKYHIFGHIHEQYGIEKRKNTTFVNCALLDDEYNLNCKPIILEI